MGLKGAPSYFQREVAHGVLGDLLGRQCALFLDDLIIFASEEDEFIANLEACLERLESAGMLPRERAPQRNVDSGMIRSSMSDMSLINTD